MTDQDLKIMEGVLHQLISGSSGETAMYFNRTSNVKSAYLPGTGVLFDVPASHFVFRTVTRSGGESREDREKVERERRESQQKAVLDFLADYAGVMSQLQPNESVMVTYRSASDMIFVESGIVSRTGSPQGFTMSALFRDISEHRTGRINRTQFDSRVIKSEHNEKMRNTDMDILMRVLETGLARGENPSFSIDRRLSYLKMDGNGYLILGSIRSPGPVSLRIAAPPVPGAAHVRMDTLRLNQLGDSIQVAVRAAMRSTEVAMAQAEEALREVEFYRFDGNLVPSVPSTPSRTPEEVKADYLAFEARLFDLILDYGRTVRDLGSNENLTFVLTLSRRIDDIPQRIIVTAPKSVIDQYDRRSITREQARTRLIITRESGQ